MSVEVPDTTPSHRWGCREDPFVSAAVGLASFGAGSSVPISALWNNGATVCARRFRCAAAAEEALYGGGFVGRLASINAGAARRRAEALCQVNEVPSMDDSGSPSNTRSRGP